MTVRATGLKAPRRPLSSGQLARARTFRQTLEATAQNLRPSLSSPSDPTTPLYLLTTQFLEKSSSYGMFDNATWLLVSFLVLGVTVSNAYRRSPSDAVTTEFPEIWWQHWQFTAAKRHIFDEIVTLFRSGDPVAESFVRDFVASLPTDKPCSPSDKYRIDRFGGIESIRSQLSGESPGPWYNSV